MCIFIFLRTASRCTVFFDAEERAMFRKLISVSRIGPKVALAVLSVLTPSDVALAVLTDNTAAFDGVAGMGKKRRRV